MRIIIEIEGREITVTPTPETLVPPPEVIVTAAARGAKDAGPAPTNLMTVADSFTTAATVEAADAGAAPSEEILANTLSTPLLLADQVAGSTDHAAGTAPTLSPTPRSRKKGKS